MDGRSRSGRKEQKRTLEGWQVVKEGNSTKEKGREKGSGALRLRWKESEASTGLPEGPAAHLGGRDAGSSEAHVRSTHNGNTQAGTHESAHLGVRALGLVSKVASKCLDDTLGFLAKEAINRDNKRGEVLILCQAWLKVLLLFARLM